MTPSPERRGGCDLRSRRFGPSCVGAHRTSRSRADGLSTDADCDGVETPDDCDDANPDSTTRAIDADCDGILTSDDCDESVPDDADCDGLPDPAGFRLIPAGGFTAGSPGAELGRSSNENLAVVELSRSFWMSATEVTQAEWSALSGGGNPLVASACDDCPVESVTWWSALGYANARSEAEGLPACFTLPTTRPDHTPCTGTWQDGNLDCGDAVPLVDDVYACTGYRLPTEAEWEYAARATTTAATYGGELSGMCSCATLSGEGLFLCGTPLADLAWYCCYSGGQPHSVARLRPNAWGLHDMLGNVQEWTWDRMWTDDAPGDGVVDGTDPQRSTEGRGGNRVFRGASWRATSGFVRAAGRSTYYFEDTSADDRGVRLVRSSR